MIPVFQTHERNCLQACIASLLEQPLHAVPDFCTMEGPAGEWEMWFLELQSFLKRKGFAFVDLQLVKELPWYPIPYGVTCIFFGFTNASKGKPDKYRTRHAVIGQFDEQFTVLHDPFPGSSGLENIDALGLLVPIDPARMQFHERNIIKAVKFDEPQPVKA